MGLRYGDTGVNYDVLDAFKRACQRAAATTVGALAQHGVREAENIRGESAYLIEAEREYWAHVEEGLGTKNLVADAVYAATGASHYRAIAIDTVATMVNDLVTSGALPISVAMHAAVGDAAFLADVRRAEDLAAGFAEGCRMSGAVWGGGETPALKGIVAEEGLVLAGSALGRIYPKERRIRGDLRGGEAIVLVESNGVQTNGLSLCRALAERLPQGYATQVNGGGTYGEELLRPSRIYVGLVRRLQEAGVRLRYAAHITGHGWRKLMRHDGRFVYRIERLPPAQPIFEFLLQHVELREAYATFNMGAGFALYVDPADATSCVEAARAEGLWAEDAGRVLDEGGRKAVDIAPLSLAFEADTLQVRG